MFFEVQTLNKYLVSNLKKLNEIDCLIAIKILQQRIKNLNSIEYYRTISVEDLVLSTRALNALSHFKLETVGDILGYGLERLGKVPDIGKRTHKEIQDLVGRIVTKKNDLIGLTGTELAFALYKKEA